MNVYICCKHEIIVYSCIRVTYTHSNKNHLTYPCARSHFPKVCTARLQHSYVYACGMLFMLFNEYKNWGNDSAQYGTRSEVSSYNTHTHTLIHYITCILDAHIHKVIDVIK